MICNPEKPKSFRAIRVLRILRLLLSLTAPMLKTQRPKCVRSAVVILRKAEQPPKRREEVTMIDWLNPSDDILEARRIGYQEGCAVGEGDRVELNGEVERLQVIIAKLPKDADGASKLPGDIVWRREDDGALSERNVQWRPEYNEGEPCYWAYWGIKGPPVPVEECYGSPEAVPAAAGGDT